MQSPKMSRLTTMYNKSQGPVHTAATAKSYDFALRLPSDLIQLGCYLETCTRAEITPESNQSSAGTVSKVGATCLVSVKMALLGRH